MSITLTDRDNPRFIFEQCYNLAMSNENYHSVSEMLWLAEFLIDNFGQSYFHYDYIKTDEDDEDSLTVLVRVRLGLSIIDLRIHPNWEEAHIRWERDGKILGGLSRLDFLGNQDEPERRLIGFINEVWAKEKESEQ